jgi:hypothetical protein
MKILAELLAALFRALLGWGQDQAEKPKTIQNANTPEDIADRNSAAYLKWRDDRVRDQPRDGH